MLKYQKLLQKSSLRKALVLWHPKRFQSTQKSKSLSSKLILGGTTLTGVAAFGLIGYISWSHNNRQNIENSIPASRYVLNLLMGPLTQITPPPISLPNQDLSLLQKKLERERNKVEEIKTDIIEPPITEEIPPLPKSNETTNADEPLPVITPRDLNEEKDDSEKDPTLDQEKLPVLLDRLMQEAKKHSLDAMTAAEDVTSAIHKYFEMAYRAIDSSGGEEELYSAAAEVANLKSESMKIAEEKLSTAKQSVSNLRSTIDEGRHNSEVVDESLLSDANEVVKDLAYEIAKISSIVSEAVRDCSAVVQLRDMVEASRKQFQGEVKSLLPDLKLGESGEPLTVDELNLLLAHAHKKVILMQGALARNQTLDKDNQSGMEGSVDSHYTDDKLKAELNRQKHELATLYRHRITELREELEDQLHVQLKRQTAAHSDHLTDALRLQQSELDRRWKNILHDGIEQKQTEFYTALSAIDGEVQGLKQGIRSRAKANDEAVNAQKLWVACEALKSRLSQSSSGQTWEEKLEPLQENIDAIKKVSGDQKEFVETILSSLPIDSLSRGVYTEEAIRERFIKVEKLCRRVAVIGDNGGSLFKYFISYIQSFLMADTYDLLSMNDMKDEEVDIMKLSTYDILARTKYCLHKDDILQSIKYMKLLRGEPRNVASDWVREALLTMEARQVADVLMTFASATTAKAL